MHEPQLIRADIKVEFLTEERCYITELCNSDRYPEASLAIARVEPDVTTQLHSLSGINETYIVIEGSGLLEVGEESFEIGPGDQVVIPAGCPQRITAHEMLRFYCLCVPRFTEGAYVNLE